MSLDLSNIACQQQRVDLVKAHYNAGLSLLQNQEMAAAKKHFNNVISLHPHHVGAYFYLGIIYLQELELDTAESIFQHVLQLQVEHVESLINLGAIAIKRDKGQEAIDYFARALLVAPDNLIARNNLAATFIQHDRFEPAVVHYQVLLQHEPHNVEYHYNLGVAQMALGHLNDAMLHFEAVLAGQPQHSAALQNLAACCVRKGDKARAIVLLQRACALHPEDDTTQFMLHALLGDALQAAPCPEYVHNLFNRYALYYEKHMHGVLQYSLPQHLNHVLHKFCQHKVAHALDAGCGTGLSGEVLRMFVDSLVGVDIAANMLQLAEKKGIYAQLVEDELVRFLANNSNKYGIITALDVLPYLGDLAALFLNAARSLESGGLFIFTCEISHDIDWQLQTSMRFCHKPAYIKELCARHDLVLMQQEKIMARMHEGQELAVMLYVAASPSQFRVCSKKN